MVLRLSTIVTLHHQSEDMLICSFTERLKNQIHAGEFISDGTGYNAFLEEACKHISETERNAMELERKVTKHYQVIYMRNHIGSEFDGVVSGVKSHGYIR